MRRFNSSLDEKVNSQEPNNTRLKRWQSKGYKIGNYHGFFFSALVASLIYVSKSSYEYYSEKTASDDRDNSSPFHFDINGVMLVLILTMVLKPAMGTIGQCFGYLSAGFANCIQPEEETLIISQNMQQV